MKTDAGLSSSLSGLTAHGKAISATAHNIANLNTEGFAPLDRHFADQRPGVKVTLSHREPPPAPPGSSGQDMGTAMVRLVGDGHAYKANLSALQQQVELDDAVLNLAAGPSSGEPAD